MTIDDSISTGGAGPDIVDLDDARIKQRLAADLDRARARTRSLTDVLDDDELVRQHSRLMSPLVWDLAHVGNQEELWLLRDVGGREPILPETVDQLYDAFQHPRADRPSLPLLDPGRSRSYVGEVRSRVLDLLERTSLADRRLTERGFVFGMIVQHEQQHAETMLATHQLRQGAPVLGAPAPPNPASPVRPAEVLIPSGPFTMGTSTHPWALDNERPAHPARVPAFYLDSYPVTGGEYQEFIADGGYDDSRWWHPTGWQHRQGAGLTAPGRPLYAGHAALPWPTDELLALWHAASLLREHRGDGHVATLLQAGLDVREVQRLAGHRGLRTTQRYVDALKRSNRTVSSSLLRRVFSEIRDELDTAA